jgi:hypothetical protein
MMVHPALLEHETYRHAHTADGGPIPAEDHVLRTSTVGQADWCPGRLAVEVAPNEAMLYGTLVHALVAWQIEHPTQDVNKALAADLADSAAAGDSVDLWQMLGGMTPYWAWIDEAVDLAAGWRQYATTNLGYPFDSPIVERKLAHPIGHTRQGVRVWLAGTADLIDGHTMLDHKTTAGPRGWYQAKADGQNQTQAYSHLAREVLGLEVERFVYVVGNRATGQWESFVARIDPAAQQSFLARALAVANMLEADTLTYHPRNADGRRAWYCSPTYCSAWSDCPAKCLADDKDGLTA